MALFSEILSYAETIYRVTSSTSNLNIETFIGTTAYQNKIRKKIIIESGVVISSSSTSTAALIFPSGLGSPTTIVNNGSILAAGGQAGTVGSPNGGNGGTAISIASGNPTVCIDNRGTIYGGGGGGGLGNNGSNGVESSQTVSYTPVTNSQYIWVISIQLSHTYSGGLAGTGGSAGVGRGYNQTNTTGVNGTLGTYGSYLSRSVYISSNAYAFNKISIPAKTNIYLDFTGPFINYVQFSPVPPCNQGGTPYAIRNPLAGADTSTPDNDLGLKIGYGCNTNGNNIKVFNGYIISVGLDYNASNPGSIGFNGTISFLRRDANQSLPGGSSTPTTIQNVSGGIVWGTGVQYPPDTHFPGPVEASGSSWVYTRDNGGGIGKFQSSPCLSAGSDTDKKWYWPSTLPIGSKGQDGGKGGDGGDWGQPGQNGGAGGAGGGGLGGLAGYYVDNSNVVWVSVGTRAGRTP